MAEERGRAGVRLHAELCRAYAHHFGDDRDGAADAARDQHVPEHIPIGQAIGSAVIASFGPRMPVRFEPVGAAKVELGTRSGMRASI